MTKRTRFPWSRLGLVLAGLFVAASAWLTTSIMGVRGEVADLVDLVSRLTLVQDALREVQTRASLGRFENDDDTVRVWSDTADVIGPALEVMIGLRDAPAHAAFRDEIAKGVDELAALREDLAEATASEASPDQAQVVELTGRAQDFLAQYVVVQRARIASISKTLWRKWQLVLLFVFLSSFLAFFSAWQFDRNRRQFQNLRKARAQLEESERRIRTVISNAPVILWAVDAEGIFTLSRGQALEVLGLAEGEVVGASVFELYAETPAILDSIRRALDGETSAGIVGIGELSFHSFYTPIRDEEGNVSGVMGCATDVTEERKAQDALHKIEEVRQESQRIEAVGRLAGGVAHEFSNLLTIISGFGSLIQTSLGVGHEVSGDLERVLKAADQAAKLTHDLLAFSRHHAVEPEVIDANKLVEEAAAMLRPVLGERIRIETRPSSRPLHVFVDPGRLEQVIVNLALNARDAMPKGGELVLETRRIRIAASGGDSLPVGDYACLRVIDTGSGMTDSVREHAFEPFFSTKERGLGTGLGLATCHGIVGQAGGGIRVESREGEGTTVEVLLPESTLSASRHVRAPGPPRAVPRGSETVLLAEDNPLVRSFAARVLSELGYSVLSAENGESALDLARATVEPIAVLVTDVVMPGMSGAELAAEMCSRDGGIKVLFISGYSGAEPLALGDRCHEAQFLAKPFSPEELGSNVRRLLDTERDTAALA